MQKRQNTRLIEKEQLKNTNVLQTKNVVIRLIVLVNMRKRPNERGRQI